jgi:hypothetical protein
VLAVVVAVSLLGARPGGDAAVAEAAMRTGTGRVVGEASVVPGHPGAIVVSIPTWAELVRSYGEPADATFWLSVEGPDGTRALRPLAASAQAEWRVPLTSDGSPVTAVSIVDGRGLVWCTARFGSA